jgi:hypothetical protein
MPSLTKRFRLQLVIVSVLTLVLAAAAMAQQSLADRARQLRKNKPAQPSTKVITNDTLGVKPAENTAAPSTDNTASDKEKAEAEKTKTLSAEEQAKLDKEWQEKIDAQKDQIALLQRELDVLQRENKLRVANYYADAGTYLRDPKKSADEQRKYQDDIAAKQKELDDAKAKLDQMHEDAHKAGANVS